MGVETAIIIGAIVAGGAAAYSSDQARRQAHEAQDNAIALANQQREWAQQQQAAQMAFQEAENARQQAILQQQADAMTKLSNTPLPTMPAPEPVTMDVTGVGAAGRRRVMPPSYYSTILTPAGGSTGGSTQKTLLGG